MIDPEKIPPAPPRLLPPNPSQKKKLLLFQRYFCICDLGGWGVGASARLGERAEALHLQSLDPKKKKKKKNNN